MPGDALVRAAVITKSGNTVIVLHAAGEPITQPIDDDYNMRAAADYYVEEEELREANDAR